MLATVGDSSVSLVDESERALQVQFAIIEEFVNGGGDAFFWVENFSARFREIWDNVTVQDKTVNNVKKILYAQTKPQIH